MGRGGGALARGRVGQGLRQPRAHARGGSRRGVAPEVRRRRRRDGPIHPVAHLAFEGHWNRVTKCSLIPAPSKVDLWRLASQVVRVARQRLAAVVGDQQEILEAHAPDPLEAFDPRLDGDDIACDERLATSEPERRWFVYLETDAVAEGEVEPARQPLTRRSGALRRVSGTLDDLRRDVVERPAADPGTRGGARRLQRLADDVS